MEKFSVVEYLAIGIANSFGKDKLNFAERIEWTKVHLKQLPEILHEADEPEMAYAGLKSLQYFLTSGQLDGHLVGLDASASVIQIISSLMRDPQGLFMTGITSPNRGDVYTSIFKNFTQFLLQKGIEIDFSNLTRSTLKDVLMKYAYGAYNEPVDVLGQQVFELFEEYVVIALPAVATYLNTLKGAQNASDEAQIYSYHWVLPDGHESFSLPFSKTGETFQSCFKGAGLDGSNAYATFSLSFFGQENKVAYIKNAANCIHSIDAFAVREMHRFINYNPILVRQWQDALNQEKFDKEDIYGTVGECPSLDLLSRPPTQEILEQMTLKYVNWLKAEVEKMLQFQPSPLLTVHDEFKALPTHLNHVREKYVRILTDLGRSQLLESIYQQITGRAIKFPRYMKENDFVKEMALSNYAIS